MSNLSSSRCYANRWWSRFGVTTTDHGFFSNSTASTFISCKNTHQNNRIIVGTSSASSSSSRSCQRIQKCGFSDDVGTPVEDNEEKEGAGEEGEKSTWVQLKQKVHFPKGPESEINHQVMALVSAMPQFAKSDFSEPESELPRQLLFKPRRNLNSYTTWRIKQLRKRRKDLLLQLGFISNDSTTVDNIENDGKEVKNFNDMEKDLEKDDTVDVRMTLCNEKMKNSKESSDENDDTSSIAENLSTKSDKQDEDSLEKLQEVESSSEKLQEKTVFSSGTTGSKNDSTILENIRDRVFKSAGDFVATDISPLQELQLIESELESLGVCLEEESYKKWRYGRVGNYDPNITVQEYLQTNNQTDIGGGNNLHQNCSNQPEITSNMDSILKPTKIKTIWRNIRDRSKMSFLMTNRKADNDAYVLLEKQRSINHVAGGNEIEENSADHAQGRVTRLSTLWTHGNSHGISWDKLDEEYIKWAKTGHDRAKRWTDCVHPSTNTAFAESSEQRRPKSLEETTLQHVQNVARWRARYITTARFAYKKAVWKGRHEWHDPTAIQKAACASGIRSAHIHKWKQLYLHWFRPGQLIRHMREMILLKQTDRELRERLENSHAREYLLRRSGRNIKKRVKRSQSCKSGHRHYSSSHHHYNKSTHLDDTKKNKAYEKKNDNWSKKFSCPWCGIVGTAGGDNRHKFSVRSVTRHLEHHHTGRPPIAPN